LYFSLAAQLFENGKVYHFEQSIDRANARGVARDLGQYQSSSAPPLKSPPARSSREVSALPGNWQIPIPIAVSIAVGWR
jgi:hypothetical protein